MAQAFRQIDEGFEWVFKAESKEDVVKRLKEWGAKCQVLVPIVRIGVGAEKPNWDLPEGMPEGIKLQEDLPAGMSDTTLQLEWRRVRQFIDPNSNMSNLIAWKREQQWINLLQGIHHTEAKLLTAVKDGKLLEMYPRLEEALPLLGITEYNKPQKTGKTKVKKNAKAA